MLTSFEQKTRSTISLQNSIRQNGVFYFLFLWFPWFLRFYPSARLWSQAAIIPMLSLKFMVTVWKFPYIRHRRGSRTIQNLFHPEYEKVCSILTRTWDICLFISLSSFVSGCSFVAFFGVMISLNFTKAVSPYPSMLLTFERSSIPISSRIGLSCFFHSQVSERTKIRLVLSAIMPFLTVWVFFFPE